MPSPPSGLPWRAQCRCNSSTSTHRWLFTTTSCRRASPRPSGAISRRCATRASTQTASKASGASPMGNPSPRKASCRLASMHLSSAGHPPSRPPDTHSTPPGPRWTRPSRPSRAAFQRSPPSWERGGATGSRSRPAPGSTPRGRGSRGTRTRTSTPEPSCSTPTRSGTSCGAASCSSPTKGCAPVPWRGMGPASRAPQRCSSRTRPRTRNSCVRAGDAT